MRRFVDRAYKLPPKTDSKSLLRSLLGGTLAIFILEILTLHSGHVFMMALLVYYFLQLLNHHSLNQEM